MSKNKNSYSSKLLALSTAATLMTGVVAIGNPHQAQASTTALDLVVKVENMAKVLKGEVNIEHRKMVDPNNALGYPDMSLFNKIKTALFEAEKALKGVNGKEKEILRARLDQNVKAYYDRAERYIDAVTASKKLESKSKLLKNKMDSNIVDDSTVKAYQDLSQEIKKNSVILSRVYGQTTRAEFRNHYIGTAQKEINRALYPVSIKMENDLLNKAIESKDTDKVIYHINRLDKFFFEGTKKNLLNKNSVLYKKLMNTCQVLKGKSESLVVIFKSESSDVNNPTVIGGTAQEMKKYNQTVVLVAGAGQYIKLANTEISGNLVIKGDATGAGTVYLDNVKVEKINNQGGSIIVDDVADHSLHNLNVTAEELKVNDTNGANIIAETGTKIKSLVVTQEAGETGGITLESKEKGAYGSVDLASKGTEKSEGITLKGDFSESKVVVTGEDSSLKVAKDAVVKEIEVKTEANVQAETGANVQAVSLDAEKKGQNISLQGDFKNTIVNITNANASITVAENTEINEVKKDSSVTENVSVENKGKIETAIGVVVTNNPPVLNNPTVPSTIPSSGGSTPATTPTATSAVALDADKDGFVDGFKVTYSEDLYVASVQDTDFTVEGYEVTGVSVDHKTVTLSVKEKDVTDVTATPKVTQVSSVEDLARNSQASQAALTANSFTTGVTGSLEIIQGVNRVPAVAATGSVDVVGLTVDTDKVVVDDNTFNYVTAIVNATTDFRNAAELQALVDGLANVDASLNGNVVTVTATTPGLAGNGIALQGGTLTNGVDAVRGQAEVAKYTILTGSVSTKDITVTVDGVAHTVSLTAGDTAAQVATKIRTQLYYDDLTGYLVTNYIPGVVGFQSTAAANVPDITFSLSN